MAKCSFCDKHIELGKGVIYVAADSVYNFCSSKCMKNSKLGRDKKNVSWIKKRKATKEELKEELLEEQKEKEEIAVEKKQEKQEIKEEKKEEKEEKKPEQKAEEKK